MKIMLTGAAGQVGQEIVRHASDHFVVKGFTSAELDITNAEAVAHSVAIYKPDIIINAAAYTAVDQAETEPDRAWRVNADGPANLGHAAHSIGAAVFHLSTDYVFAGDQSDAYTETDHPAPTGAYGASKLAGERALTNSRASSLILRTSWVFGAHGKNFVKTMVKLGNEREELGVVNDQFGCPTSAESIAKCIVQLARQLRSAGDLAWGTYHFTGAHSCSWYAFATIILDRAYEIGLINKRPVIHPIGTQDYPTPARRPAFSVLDCSLLQSTFGISQPDWQHDLYSVLKQLKHQKT